MTGGSIREYAEAMRKRYWKADRKEKERMLRIYFLQQWYGLSDPGMEDALYDSESMRRFAGIDLESDPVPDETTILNFRHYLEEYHLTEKIFEKTKQYLSEKGVMLREGTIVDATIINAPGSTKNESRTRDPEMKQTKKGNQWHVDRKGSPNRPLTQEDKEWNHEQHRTRAKGEHGFLVVKHLWGYRKVRYKGLYRNAAQVFSLFALANLYLVRRDLLLLRG